LQWDNALKMSIAIYYNIWCYKQLNFMIYSSSSCLPISVYFCSDSVVTHSENSMTETPSHFESNCKYTPSTQFSNHTQGL